MTKGLYERTPKIRKQISVTLKRLHKERAFRRRFLKMMRSEEYHDAVSEATLQYHKENKDYVLERKAVAKANGVWKKTEAQKRKYSRIQKKIGKDPAVKQHRSEAQKKLRAENPDWVRRNAVAVAEGKRKSRKISVFKKTGLEKRVHILLRKLGLQYRYVGNWKFPIGSHCPDFVHKRFHWIIEAHGGWWHRNDDGSKVRDFEAHGYKVLVIWDYELADEAALIRKIRKFHRQPNARRNV